MSGYIVVINRDGSTVDENLISHLTGFLSFRGPDNQGYRVLGQVAMGHALLRSATDSLNEVQPYSIDNDRWIAGDVRLDARADLIVRMQPRVEWDLTHLPDIALVMTSYHLWGKECLEQLQGDFSFVIWSRSANLIFGARDHLGVKPFYFASLSRYLIISNTLNAIRLHPEVSDDLNLQAIGDYLIAGSNQYRDQTYFREIQRLQAAHCITCEAGEREQIRRYWTLPIEDTICYKTDAEYVEHFTSLLDTAVSERVRWHNAGILMSGGLDSTSVAASAALIREEGAGGGPDLKAFTVISRQLFHDEEIQYSKIAANHLRIPIEQISIDDHRIFNAVADDCSLTLPPAPFTYYFRRRYRHYSNFSPILLTGHGGDVILRPSAVNITDGYHWRDYLLILSRFIRYYRQFGRMPRIGLRTAIRKRLGLKYNRYTYPTWINPAFERAVDLKERYDQLKREISDSKETVVKRLDAYLVLVGSGWADSFEQYDAGQLGSPIRISHPLFDLRMVRYCLRLPSLPWCSEKYIMRASSAARLPTEITARSKKTLPAGFIRAILKSCDYSDLFNTGVCSGRHNLEMEQWVDIKQVASQFSVISSRRSRSNEPVTDGYNDGRSQEIINDVIRLESLSIWCGLRTQFALSKLSI